jgi:uncharacterized surface protein with fasciclin (FAS1) repeats
MKIRILTATMLAGGIAVSAAACGGSDDKAAGSASAPAAGSAPSTSPAMSDKPFGAACSAVPSSGKGSFSGMSQDPVATAASNNPVLTTLVTAVKKAGLVDTLNSAQNITVFAPTNDAFKKIPSKTLNKVLADKKTLSSILTYHVVGQKVAPGAMAAGNFKTLQGGMVTTSGSGESYKVNDANVVCGNVQTANATVYLIDTVMMPKM